MSVGRFMSLTENNNVLFVRVHSNERSDGKETEQDITCAFDDVPHVAQTPTRSKKYPDRIGQKGLYRNFS